MADLPDFGHASHGTARRVLTQIKAGERRTPRLAMPGGGPQETGPD
jgi:hypothetical protein